MITSFGPNCEEYIKVVSNLEHVIAWHFGGVAVGSNSFIYGMAHFVAIDIMICSTPDLSIFLAKGVSFRQISQNHSNKKGLKINEFYIGTNMERLCFRYLLLKKTDK
jgi:hypothetical protein